MDEKKTPDLPILCDLRLDYWSMHRQMILIFLARLILITVWSVDQSREDFRLQYQRQELITQIESDGRQRRPFDHQRHCRRKDRGQQRIVCLTHATEVSYQSEASRSGTKRWQRRPTRRARRIPPRTRLGLQVRFLMHLYGLRLVPALRRSHATVHVPGTKRRTGGQRSSSEVVSSNGLRKTSN